MRRLSALAVVGAIACGSAGAGCSSGKSDNATITTRAPAQATTTTASTIPIEQLQASASTITDQLIAHKWPDVVAHFSATMQAGLTAPGLMTAWGQVEATYGAYKSRATTTRVHPEEKAVTVFDTPMVFGTHAMKSRVSFDASGDVAGLYILQATVA